jgi:hypothetical protein
LHVLVAHRPSRAGYVPQNSNGTLVMAPHPRRGRSECAVPPLEIGVQAIQLSPYHAGLAGRHPTRLPVTPAFPTCSCPLRLSPSGKSMTQESPCELLLTVSRFQHRVPRRTLSPHTAQHLLDASSPATVFRHPTGAFPEVRTRVPELLGEPTGCGPSPCT